MKKINTALILCAGFGKRLKPISLKIPKPLIKINNITLLDNTLNLIEKLEVKNIKINAFHLQEQIVNFISDHRLKNNIEIVNDGIEFPLDTGGGILNMIHTSNEENFIIFNPDTLWKIDSENCIKEMENFYFSKKIQNILMVVNKDLSFDKNLRGDFNLLDNQLNKKKLNQYIFTGCQIINKKVFASIKNKSFSILQIWNDLIKENKLYGYESKNKFYHVTDLEIYNKLLKSY